MMSKSPNNILELVAALEGLKKENLNDEFDLFWACQEVFEKLKRLSDFDPSNLNGTIKILRNLPPEIQELSIKELGTEEKILETKALNQQDLKELIEEYEKAQNDNQKERLSKEIYERTGQKNVKQFIETQKEIASKNAEKLNKLSSEIKEKVVENLAINRLTEREELIEIVELASLKSDQDYKAKELKKELEKNGYSSVEANQIIKTTQEIREEIKKENIVSPEIKKKTVDDLIKDSFTEREELIEIVELASLKSDQDYKAKELKKELEKRIKNPEKIEDLIKRVEEIRAEIKIEEKAEEIAKTTNEKLIEEKMPISTETKENIKKEILVAWKEGDRFRMPQELSEIKGAKVIIKETEKAVDIFKNENIRAIVNYRSLELEREISQGLRKNGVENEKSIKEYASIVNKLTYNSEIAVEEENRSKIYDFVESKNPNKGPGEIERSIDEAQFMAKNVVMAPKKFNKLIKTYNNLREKIGVEKLPKIKEVRVVDKLAAIFKNNPRMLAMINGAQKSVGLLGRINAFPTKLIGRFGGKVVQKLEGKVLEKIGGQAAIEFTKNAAAIIAKEGTLQGIKTIAGALFTRGTVTAGTAAAGGTATGGSLAGLLAAFQALPIVGQVIAVIVMAVVAVVTIIKPIIDGAKKFLGKVLNVDMNGVKHFLSDSLGLGGFIGGVGQFTFDVATFFVGIPALLGAITITALVAPVVIFFFLGIMAYSLLSENLISSIIPPTKTQGGYCILKSTQDEENGGAINCNQMAPENDFPGINKANFVRVATQWKSGKNYAEECYNDTVNRALCAGKNPAYALWAWVHESGASNYFRDDIEDFGIHYIPEKRNYDKQITAFLKLDPGSACPGLGYWLSFATNYLTGGCDPDKPVSVTGQTGRDYLAGMQQTWSWISSLPMPADIKVPVAGTNCNQTGNSSDLPVAGEYTDENGDVWVCFGEAGNVPGENPNFTPWDPSIPVPEGCPSGKPTSGYFTQGPFASGCSHQSMSIPAVDIGAGNGTVIVATHPGVAVLGYDGIYGYYIDVHGKCEGKEFYTRYAHMPPGGYAVGSNQTVSAGQKIGVVNNTGSSTGPHLHYHISGLDTNKFGQYLGLSVSQTQELWGCCGSWNGKYCP